MRYFGDFSPTNWLFRPLDGLPPQAVLDANVMLDIMLMVDSIGRFVAVEARRRGISLHTSRRALEEVRARLVDYNRKGFADLSPLIDPFIEQFGIIAHDCAGDFRGIRAHDEHLAVTAAELGAFVLSEDLPFLLDADRAKVHARSLREAAYSLILPLRQPAQELSIFGVGAGADGHIFTKFMLDLDPRENANPLMFLFDAPEFGSLRYERLKFRFVFCCANGQEIILPIGLLNDSQYSLLINYSVGSDMRVTIKARRFGDAQESSVTRAISAPKGRPTGSITILNSRDKNAGWSGSLQVFTFGPYRLSSKVWKASHSLIGVAPPTLTSDLAFHAASLIALDGDKVRMPLRQHVLELANVTVPGFYPGRRVNERSQKWFE